MEYWEGSYKFLALEIYNKLKLKKNNKKYSFYDLDYKEGSSNPNLLKAIRLLHDLEIIDKVKEIKDYGNGNCNYLFIGLSNYGKGISKERVKELIEFFKIRHNSIPLKIQLDDKYKTDTNKRLVLLEESLKVLELKKDANQGKAE